MVMVANLHAKQKGESVPIVQGGHWASSFRDYCKAEGIIDDRFDGSLDISVTREEMAYYFANALTAESYKNKLDVELNDIAGSPYETEIRRLAAADIVGGVGEGKYAPAASVTRAQAAVFVSNILDAMNVTVTSR